MRKYATAYYNQPSRDSYVTLPWLSEGVGIVNTTQYTLCVRVGGLVPPSGVDDADIAVPPAGMFSMPAEAREFSWAYTLPQLSGPIPGMPTTSKLTFVKGEPLPQFSSAPSLSLIGLIPSEQILKSQTVRAAGAYNDLGIAVPSDVRTLSITNLGSDITSLVVTGEQSGLLYFVLRPNLFTLPVDFNAPIHFGSFLAALDTSVAVGSTSTGGSNGYVLVGHRNAYQPGVFLRDRRQLVEVRPPSYSWLPVAAPDPIRAYVLPVGPYSAPQTASRIDTRGYTRARVTVKPVSGPGSGTCGITISNSEAQDPGSIAATYIMHATTAIVWGGNAKGFDVAAHDQTVAAGDLTTVAGTLPRYLDVVMGATAAGTWNGGFEIWLS